MKTIHFYKVKLKTYHGEIVGRIAFHHPNGEEEESSLYTLSEINSIIEFWKSDKLLGSFAIGTILAHDADCLLEKA